MSPETLLAAVFAVLAVGITLWAASEAMQARAWAWLVSVLVLWPVGVLAWFVAGRRHYLR